MDDTFNMLRFRTCGLMIVIVIGVGGGGILSVQIVIIISQDFGTVFTEIVAKLVIFTFFMDFAVIKESVFGIRFETAIAPIIVTVTFRRFATKQLFCGYSPYTKSMQNEIEKNGGNHMVKKQMGKTQSNTLCKLLTMNSVSI